MPYNVRATIGKKKGQFVKQKTKERIEAVVRNTHSKQGRRLNTEAKPQKTVKEKTKYRKFHGRRIADMDKVAEELWCTVCDMSISMRFLLKEKRRGIASKCTFECQSCKNIVIVETSTDGSIPYYYDSNLKLAAGMLDAGMGETKVNTLLSALNIPTVSDTSLKRYERAVGSAVEKLAERSCVEAIELEKKLSLEANANNANKEEEDSDVNNNEVTDLIASFDAAWTKRGRQNNSLSGHASLNGYFSKKVLAYACRDLDCKQCKQRKNKFHVCKKNHSGSSKSMEADMAVDVVLKNENLIKSNCRIKILIGDDDSSAIAALRRLSPYSIQKWSDFNHVAKTFNSKLYEMKLNAKLREYFSKVFALAIKKNQGDEVGVKIALQNITAHAFGDHQNCGTFCERTEDNQHVYKYFKDNKCLSDMNLKDKLDKIIQPFINSTPQIAQCASSQSNESFNNTVCSKHPKSQFYGGSESHTYRVAVAVCQKNYGYEYIVKLNTLMNLSPGKNTLNFRKRKQEICNEIAEKRRKIESKKRRLVLKKQRSSKDACVANREGIAYKSGSGYLNTSDLIDQVMIPDNVNIEDCKVVVFDLETTSLHGAAEIIQIAAACGKKTFNVYIMPTKDMSPNASEVTGIVIRKGDMYVHEEKVLTYSCRDAFLSFLYFLKKQRSPCILLAHNCFRFDATRIIKTATSLGLLKEMKMFVKGFADSLYIFKSLLPERRKLKQSYSQTALAADYLDKADVTVAHNAINDVLMLQKLINKFCNDVTSITAHTRSLTFVMNAKERTEKTKTCKKTLDTLNISNSMKCKLSNAGIDKSILKKACEGGIDGLTILLAENVDGKPRITKNARILKTLFQQLQTED